MKLELKHIVGYLPYNLQIIDVETNEIDTIKNLGLVDSRLEYGKLMFLLHGKYFKPILRPMSDLHKDVNGKMAIKDLWEADLFGSDARDDEMPSYFMSEWTLAELMDSIPFAKYERLFDFLFQHHFDIHGLIEQGLAIDVNTL